MPIYCSSTPSPLRPTPPLTSFSVPSYTFMLFMPPSLLDSVWLRAKLVQEVQAEVVKWILPRQSHQGKGRKRKRMEPKVNHQELSSDQMVMLLELLLEEATMSHATMQRVHKAYALHRHDAEVRHRWCELVVKQRFSQAYADVEYFLIHDQAMGVYLYGELMVHEDARQQALARRCLTLSTGYRVQMETAEGKGMPQNAHARPKASLSQLFCRHSTSTVQKSTKTQKHRKAEGHFYLFSFTTREFGPASVTVRVT
uniref:Peptidase M1 leukotriene A4 hydrolase/aminopeptidase C-terminal domain-containing protein n=1 Tax=Knipowitschia caucasica TaxID=637954 RepID=A0AAV2MRF4_KNICA